MLSDDEEHPQDQPPLETALIASLQTNNSVELHHDRQSLTRQPSEMPLRILKGDELSGFERWLLRVAWANLIILFLIFAVFYLQLRESKTQTKLLLDQRAESKHDAAIAQSQTQQQIRNSMDSLRRDQQPYVWIDGSPTEQTYKVPGTSETQILVNANYKNFGKSPAIATQRYSNVQVGPGAIAKIQAGNLAQAKSLVPPTKSDFFTAATAPLTSVPDLTGDDAVVLYTRMQYLDSLGHRYETNFCMSRLHTGTWRYCPVMNDIKDCASVKCEP